MSENIENKIKAEIIDYINHNRDLAKLYDSSKSDKTFEEITEKVIEHIVNNSNQVKSLKGNIMLDWLEIDDTYFVETDEILETFIYFLKH